MPDIIIDKRTVVEKDISYSPPANGTYSKPIKLDVDNLYPMSLIYSGDEQTGEPLTARNLADISTINNVNGVPLGMPANNGLGIVQWDYYKPEWYNVNNFKLHIDLGAIYDIDYAFVWIPASAENQGLVLYSSRNGTDNLIVADTQGTNISTGSWLKIEFTNSSAQGGIRYFTIGMKYPASFIKGFVLYGRKKGVVINKGLKKRRNVNPRSYDKVIGTNGFYFEEPEMLSRIAGLARWYTQPDWWVGESFRNVGSAYNHTVDEFNFRFDNSHMGSLDQQLQAYKNYGTKSMFTPTQSPQALRPIGTANPGLSKPINPGLSTINLTATTNPINYTFISRLYWNIAARYGSNINADLQFVQLDQGVSQPIRIGLGIMEALEVGNEYDAWWNGEAAYFNPEEMAAYMSAIYDGHKGIMGEGFGAKNADPSIKVVMVAIALSDNITYVKRMIWWWDKNRGKGNYPIDVLNFHYYNSTGGSQLVNDGTGIHGLQPEKGDLIKTCDLWTDFRDKYLPFAEIWCSETGYDEHLGGKLSPLRNTPEERARMKSYWLGRLMVVMQMHGMDAIQHYWYSNHSYPWFQAQKVDEPNPASFMSSGLVDGNYPEDYNHRYPLMSYYYVATYRHILTGYTFSHSVMEEGVYKIEEQIFTGDTSTLWAACYKNYKTDETLLLVWLGSADFVTKNIGIKIAEASTVAINVEEAEERTTYDGVEIPLVKANNVVSLVASECIKFVKTATVGTPKLLQPTKVEVQKINNGSLITWQDNNVKNVLVRISRSTDAEQGFTVLVEDVYNTASYFDATAGSTDYFYKVQAVKEDTPIEPEEPIDPEEPVDPPAPGVDEDPFLATWNTGTRVSGMIPWEAHDAYLEDNVHDVQGFGAWKDGATTNFYNDAIKIQDNPSYPIRINIRKYKPTVTSIRVLLKTNYVPTNFYYIKAGEFTKRLIATTPETTSGWTTLPLPQAENVTWIIIEPLHRGDSPNEVQINGSYVVPPVVNAVQRNVLFKDMTWQNAFEWNILDNDGRPYTPTQRIALFKQHQGMRHYLDRIHMEPSKGDFYFAPSYNGAGSWNYDNMYQLMKDNGIDVRVCIKNSPDWLQNTWPSELRGSEQLPVEYETSREVTTAKAMLPESYLAEGKLFFQFVARYGSVEVALDRISVHTEQGQVFPHNQKRTGLNLVNKVEVTNEPDSWWHGWQGFSKARQLAARMSCVYDGHMGTLGANVGAKAADPNVSVSFPGLGVATIEEYMSVLDWCREFRGYNQDGSINVPFDVVNYHVYSNDGGSTQYGTATRGLPPEESGFLDKMQYFIDFTNEHLKGMPVILGEYGYDISQFSKQRSARVIDLGNETSDKTLRKLVQAQWTLRSMLCGWIVGLLEQQSYMLDDVSNDEYGNYAQGGFVDNMTRRPVGNFTYQAKALLGEYYRDAIISKTSSAWVIRGKNSSNEVMYVLWIPTETGATGTYNLAMAGVTSVKKYVLSENSIIPTETTIAVTGGTLNVAISETPVFIKVI